MGIIDTEYDEAKVMERFENDGYRRGKAEESQNTERERRRADHFKEQLIAACITPDEV